MGSRSAPRQGSPGERLKPSMAPFWAILEQSILAKKTRPRQEELAGPKRQDPGKRSLPGRPAEEQRPRQEELAGKANQGILRKLAATHHAPRPGLASGKFPGATRQPQRQATCRGKSPPRACAPAHPPTRQSGALPEARGWALRSRRHAVACDADKIAIMANGGAPNGPLRHCSGDPDGHLMPLSPGVRVRCDSTMQPLYAQSFTIFTLICAATCG